MHNLIHVHVQIYIVHIHVCICYVIPQVLYQVYNHRAWRVIGPKGEVIISLILHNIIFPALQSFLATL